MSDHKKPINAGNKGLANLGNTCYMFGTSMFKSSDSISS